MNIQIYLWVPDFNSFEYIPRGEMAGFCCNSIVFKALPLWLHRFTFPLTIHQGLIFFTLSPTLWNAFHHIHQVKVGWREVQKVGEPPWEPQRHHLRAQRAYLGISPLYPTFPQPRVCLLCVVRGWAVRTGAHQLSKAPCPSPLLTGTIIWTLHQFQPFWTGHAITCLLHKCTHTHTLFLVGVRKRLKGLLSCRAWEVGMLSIL